jgi:ribose transport system ATP-binding protein
VSFIYVSHRLEEIARICDRVVVLRDGQWVNSFESAQVPVRQLVEAMVGRSIENVFPRPDAAR